MSRVLEAAGSASLPEFDLYIDGRREKPIGGAYFPTDNPYTGEVWAQIARGTSADVDLAVAAARRALPVWNGLKPSERGRLLTKMADLVEANVERLAGAEVRDNGKLFAEMLPQMRLVADWFRYYGGMADKIEGTVIPTGKPDMLTFTRQEPLGVVGLITPWNSPLLLLTHKLPTALAAGNTVVIKPSEFTSSSTLVFVELFEQAGFPPGVVNVVSGYGHEAGAALVAHPDIAKIAMTGSEAGGRKINEAAACDFKHVALELGGKSPNIVFADADFEAAVVGAIAGIFAASGQTCIAGSRLLLQRSIHDRFVERLVEIAGQARIGDPMLATTHVGPVATSPQFDKVLQYIEIAKGEGATCVLGGGAYTGEGAQGGRFVAPTIFTGVNNQMRIAREEVFGPVLSIIPFDTEEEAYEIANDTPYGLAAGVWTSDMGRMIRASERLQAGTVWVNTYRVGGVSTPFGGYKHSGLGREGGIAAIKEWQQTKTVWICGKPDTNHPFVMRH
ncbi:MAG: aldehyde dehydrogenase [Pseudomonas sp.]|uniref:aldehyde dehydrogenase n=1 Tax=Pseudomonas sp. TaxID=306 RepID=UPI0039820B0C